nr:hypothetical protein [Salinispora pacifica]
MRNVLDDSPLSSTTIFHAGDRGESVRDGVHRAASHELVHGFLDHRFDLRVEGAGRLIQDEDRRVLVDGTSEPAVANGAGGRPSRPGRKNWLLKQ